MKAAIFYGPDRPLIIEDVVEPKIEPTEVLVAVRICGICHTDVVMIKGVYLFLTLKQSEVLEVVACDSRGVY